MRILIVFHGWFPTPGRPVAGGALRAWHHAEALTAAGHDVHLVTRQQDVVPGGPPGFSSGPGLLAHAERVQPDALLVVQPEEAPALEPLGLPMVVDLYAPRILEAQFQDATGIEAVNTLRAIRAGDFFLFSNHRQRFYFLGLLALAGVDLRSHDFGAVVPLVAPEGPERSRPRSPVFVMGGVSWPWIDPTAALGRAVAHLNKRRRGKVLVLGRQPVLGDSSYRDLEVAVPPGKRLAYTGLVAHDEILRTYAGATAAIDMMAPTPERDLAVAFRHMDYLGCGLPMLVGAEHVLAESLAEAGAGVVGLEIEAAIDAVLDDPEAHAQRSIAARQLARSRFSRAVCEAPLLAWFAAPVRRDQRATPLGSLAETSARAARAERAEQAALADLRRLAAEVESKRGEVAGLVQQSRVLSVATERLAGSVAEVAGFKREAIAVLGGAQARAQEELSALQARSTALEADVAKKASELAAALREKGLIQDRLQDLGKQLAGADAQVQALRTERDVAVEARVVAEADGLKKSVEIDALGRQQELLRDQIGALERRLTEADAAATTLRVQVAAAESAGSEARAEAGKKSVEIGALVREKQALGAHLEQVQRQERTLRAEAARLGTELARATAGVAEQEREAAKKGAELLAMTRERDLLRERLPGLEDQLTVARQEQRSAKAELRRLATALAVAQADGEKKDSEIETLAAEAREASSEQHALSSQLAGAQADAAKKTAEQDALQLALDQARAASQAQAAALLDAQADGAKKGAEIEALGAELAAFAARSAGSQASIDQLRAVAAESAAVLHDVQADAAKKAAEIEALQAALARARSQGEGQAASLLEAQADATHKAAEIEGLQRSLGRLRTRAEADAAALQDARTDAAKKGAELEGVQHALAQLRPQAEADALALKEALTAAARAAAELEAAQRALAALRPTAEADAVALQDARADAAKKGAEIEALQLLIAQERRGAEAAQAELVELRVTSARAGAELSIAQQQLDQARGELAATRQSVQDATADAAAKGAELAGLQRESEKLEGAVSAAQAQTRGLQDKLEQQAAELARRDQAQGGLQARSEALEVSLADVQADIDKKNTELEAAWSERERLEGVIAGLRSGAR
jgi:chromosome segregation ATPase